jgi:hypothetical protein
VENTLRVWAISRWRSPTQLTRRFLAAGYAHLPEWRPLMYRIEEVRDSGGFRIAILA